MGRSDLQTIGNDAEARALDRLTRHGLKLLSRNFRCRLGEIDLVMRDGHCLVFVEVRYRRAGSRTGATESIGPRKRRRVTLAAARFLALNQQYRDAPVRFDVVAIDGRPGGEATLCWIPDAFRPGE